MPSSWVTNDSTTPSSYTWTISRPQYSSSYPVIFMATQMKMSDGSVTTSYPSKDETTTVIDGGHITTGTIDASRVYVTNINADNITSGYINADRIRGGEIDARYIDVTHLDANNITSGYINGDRIEAHTITAGEITYDVLDGLKFGSVKVYNGQTRQTDWALSATVSWVSKDDVWFELTFWNGWLVNVEVN
jgi:hypothetical protein